jgi:hypothetical protein
MNQKVQLGDECRDTVTGFKGVAIVRSEYISGCARVGLQPPVDKDGKIPDAMHFDEPMLEVLIPKLFADLPSNKGGPRPAPSQHAAPTR